MIAFLIECFSAKKFASILTVCIIFLANINFAQFDNYNQIPTPNSFRVNKIEVTDDNQIFICTFLKGIYHSEDNGETWKNFGPYNQSIDGIKVDSKGHYYMIITSYTYGNKDFPGIFKSTNQGKNWQRISEGINYLYVRDIVINKNDSVFIGTKEGGVFYFNDSTEIWENIGLQGEFVRSLNIDSIERIYATIDNVGIFRKKNTKSEWEKLGDLRTWRCPEIFITDKDIIYLALGADNPQLNMGIFKSSDDGKTWKEINNGITDYDIRTICSGKDESLYAGASRGQIFNSINGGDSWMQLDLHHTNASISSLRATKNGSILNSSWGGGILRLENNGNKWEVFGPTLNATAWNFEMFNDKLFCLTTGGIYKSENLGIDWKGINKNLPNFDVNGCVFTNEGNLVLSTWGSGVYFSEDLGGTWSKNNDIPVNATITFLKKSSSTGSIFVGVINDGHGLYKSTDGGLSFNKIMNWERPETMYISENGDLLVGTWDIHYSKNDGESWKRIWKGNIYFSTVMMDNQEKIYAGSLDGYFFTSNNLGESWTEKYYSGINFTRMNFLDDSMLVVSTYDKKNYIFEDNDFIEIELEWLTNCSINSVNKVGEKTLVSTDKGLYIKSDPILAVNSTQNIKDFTYLENAYPNPFNPITTIKYSILSNANDKSTNVNLIVYDALGNEIETLVYENQSAGNYEIEFDGSKLASGIYYYKLQVGGFIETKKMILMK